MKNIVAKILMTGGSVSAVLLTIGLVVATINSNVSYTMLVEAVLLFVISSAAAFIGFRLSRKYREERMGAYFKTNLSGMYDNVTEPQKNDGKHEYKYDPLDFTSQAIQRGIATADEFHAQFVEANLKAYTDPFHDLHSKLSV